MTEQEWLASEDPAAMVAYLESGYQQLVTYARSPQVFSDRKLRRWVEACREAEGGGGWGSDLSNPAELHATARLWAGTLVDPADIPPTLKAHLLREIFGNPFRPVHFVPGHYYYDALTPAALDLARCAYGEMCPECSGSGAVENDTGGNVGTKHCRTCHGTGYTAPDWGILPVLADMLEENGCDSEDLLLHLRGAERCPECLGKAHFPKSVFGPDPQISSTAYSSSVVMVACKDCHGTGHIPLRGPHVRGCWALELILGRGD